MIKISTPMTRKTAQELRMGDSVLITGDIYTARDLAHMRMIKAIQQGKELPFQLEDQIIFYAGPSPAPPGQVIGSVGPTTAIRMDTLTTPLLERGLRAMIGKGQRSETVKKALIEFGSVYFAAIGGAAALLAGRIKRAEIIAYPDLGTEAVRRLTVEDFPVVVANDSIGGDLFLRGV